MSAVSPQHRSVAMMSAKSKNQLNLVHLDGEFFEVGIEAAVDALLERLVSAKTKGQMLSACRALERVIAHSHILVPEWAAGTHRIVYSARRLALPPSMPPYAANELWAVQTWWAK